MIKTVKFIKEGEVFESEVILLPNGEGKFNIKLPSKAKIKLKRSFENRNFCDVVNSEMEADAIEFGVFNGCKNQYVKVISDVEPTLCRVNIDE